MRKVPEITALFWVIKILTTAFGESTSDFLVQAMNPVVGVDIAAVFFIVALIMQFRTRRYVPWIYWSTVAMVAVFGTMVADSVHVGLGVPYFVSTIFFTIALIVIFFFWYRVEKTLSIHSIDTRRREYFYWATVITTFALGTAAGDMTASSMGLGYLESGIIFGILIAIVAIAHYIARGVLSAEHRHQSRNAVLAFWLAYILTRPLGASFADWFGKSPSIGGLGWGDGMVSAILAVIIIALVAYLAITRIDVEKQR
jgi:uncharacterized membrane-anchored protein